MATGTQVLEFLCPNIEWTIYNDDYDSIIWHNSEAPISKEEFEAGFVQYDAWKAEQDAAAKAQKQAILDRLGLTEDELRIVLG